MDPAEYQRRADQLGAGPEETAHALACAHWDLARRPETARGRDAHQLAADALAAARVPAQQPLAEVRFQCHSWGPGGLTPALYGPTPADEYMRWYEQATTRR